MNRRDAYEKCMTESLKSAKREGYKDSAAAGLPSERSTRGTGCVLVFIVAGLSFVDLFKQCL